MTGPYDTAVDHPQHQERRERERRKGRKEGKREIGSEMRRERTMKQSSRSGLDMYPGVT